MSSRSLHRVSRVALAAAALLAATALAACRGEPEAAPLSAPVVELAPVETRKIVDRIEAIGSLLAVEEAEIAAEVEGRVTELLSDEGSAVAPGDPLLLIDPERRELERADAKAQLAEARAALLEAEREFERIGKLEARGAVSSSQRDDAETRLAGARSRRLAAEARLGVADRSLREATVRAPFAGLIARRFVSRGEFVRAGSSLFELVALDPIEVEFHLAEVESSRVALGIPVDVSVSPYPNELFQAKVTMISPTIDTRTRTLRVKAELSNADGRLRPGLFARADLGLAERPAVAMIPEEAVLQRADGAVVFRLAGDRRVERRVVQTGVHRGGQVEVIDALAKGDWVVTRGHASLLDGSPVEARLPGGKPFPGGLPPVSEGERAGQ